MRIRCTVHCLEGRIAVLDPFATMTCRNEESLETSLLLFPYTGYRRHFKIGALEETYNIYCTLLSSAICCEYSIEMKDVLTGGDYRAILDRVP